ncbi:MAG: hypothetical protein JSV54_07505 [Chloroflexota bacterium]|nr:MAG: hypothetical protein JSV54_07505 [Chloroflexota bacterium]
MSTESEIPNYTTYKDESGLFSVSYPADWEITPPEVTPFGQNAKETISRLQAGSPVEEFSVIFFGGKPDQGAYEPYVIIGVGPVPAEISTLDQLVDSDIRVDKETYSDFQELTRIKTTIDGKEATILDWEGTIPEEQYKLYCLQLYILTDKALWVVTCGSRPENSAQWKNDFNTIVRSLRISN